MREIKFRAWNEVKKRMEYDVYKECHNLMQFTGLKDRNGKEIYEGDVVERYYPSLGRVARRVVVYHDDGFRLKEIGKFKGLALLSPAVEDIEVIGNIYENPNWESESHEVD